MAAEFTGERVVPGEVDTDLWNEHIARYVFAARLARGKRVLDIGCGTGYGTAELARSAATVTALDVSADAVRYVSEHYIHPSMRLLRASATQLPLRDGAFDLAVCFEVIEHLEGWRELLEEVRRVLAPGGQLIVSTPNKSYYADSRKLHGPNPFHTHEFEFEEFRQALAEYFPHVMLFTENHADGIVFKPIRQNAGVVSADIRVEGAHTDPAEAHFYVAVCAMIPQTGAPTFVYMPTSANVLRERELHIGRLEQELSTKNEWLEAARGEHKKLVTLHAAQTRELEERNQWAFELDGQLKASGERVKQVQDELAEQQAKARAAIDHFEAEVARLETELQAKIDWGLARERELSVELESRVTELAQCVELLHEAERQVEERTAWALNLQKEIATLEERLATAQSSKWMRLGRALHLGPELRKT